jgi:deoxyribose-phosphate aldolase
MVNETLGEAWLDPHLFRFGASTLMNDLVRQLIRMEMPAYAALPGVARYAAGYDLSE